MVPSGKPILCHFKLEQREGVQFQLSYFIHAQNGFTKIQFYPKLINFFVLFIRISCLCLPDAFFFADSL
jgi:hypothetical protein